MTYLRAEELHGLIVGMEVVDKYSDIPYQKRTNYTVISIGGLLKTDHIQLDDKNSPWLIAGEFRETSTIKGEN